ncbi:MAG TPA: hypothetical protein VGQ37_15070 [Vicinamibacterales bacterium]|jgi:hypothetical protein|nr:hypothetical protein [Vicinamibacterales bacterium]
MTKTLRILMCAAALAVAMAPRASAQTIDAGEVMFHWGPIHMAPGQALALNVELTDHFGDPLTVPLELHVEDKNGAVVVSRTLTMSDGRSLSFVIGPEIRAARATIPGDIYAAVAPDVRLLQPCLRVGFPAGMPPPVERITLTLEVMDVASGRIVSVMNNPRAIIGVL